MYTALYRSLPPTHQAHKILAHYRRFVGPGAELRVARMLGLWVDNETGPGTQRVAPRRIGGALQYGQPQPNSRASGYAARFGRWR